MNNKYGIYSKILEESAAVRERSNRKWQELTIAGLQFHQGRLYGISEAFSSLLVVDLDGSVDAVLGLNGINESSGITVRDDVLTLVGDAEGYLPPPPIYLLDPSAIQTKAPLSANQEKIL